MSQLTRVLAALVLAVLVSARSSFAVDSASTSFTPGLGGPFDSFKKGSLKMSATSSLGANGMKFKFTLSGATLAGVPANASQLKLRVFLIHDTGSCIMYESPEFNVVDGKAKVLFDGSTLVPPLAENGAVTLCSGLGGAITHVYHVPSASVPAYAGVRLGTDAD